MMEPEEAFRRISKGLERRLGMLEAKSTGAPPPTAVLIYPTGAPAAEIAAFEADLAERRRANPRQSIIVVDTGIHRGEPK